MVLQTLKDGYMKTNLTILLLLVCSLLNGQNTVIQIKNTPSSGTGSVIVIGGTAATTFTAYTVGGGGQYCEYDSYSTVTLSGSETGKTYTIFVNDVKTDSSEAGTGSVLSFNVADTGTVTIYAYAGSDSSLMTASAEVSECAILKYNPAAWYDAKDASTVIVTTTVDSVLDKSGNGNTLHRVTQLTGGPTLTNNQMIFTYASGKLLYRATYNQGTLAQPNTIFLLSQHTDSLNSQIPLSSRNATNRNEFYITAGTFRAMSGAAISAVKAVDKQLHLHVGVFNGTSGEYFLDGVKAVGNISTQSMIGITLGARNDNGTSAGVKINEVIVYDGLLNDLQIEEVTAYLQDKWDLTGITYANYVTYEKENVAYRDGDKVTISSRMGDGKEDMITILDKAPSNNIITVYKRGFNNNITNIVDTLFAIDTLLMWARSDNIGPYLNKSVDGEESVVWSGGAHTKITGIKAKILFFNYVSGKMKISNATYFPDSIGIINVEDQSGNSRGYFKYNGKTATGDTLKDVVMSTSYPLYIVANDSVFLCQRTVKSSTVTYTYNNGTPLPENEYVQFDSLKAHVVNEIFGGWTINDTTGNGTVLIEETADYVIRERGQTEVELKSVFQDSILVSRYYGMQRILSENGMEQTTYIAKAENPAIRAYSPYYNSGAYPTYPSDRMIMSGKGLNHAWWLDLTYGLPDSSWGFTNYSIGGSGKYYFYQIDQVPEKKFGANDSVYWHGGFNYFRNDLKTNSSYAYFQYEKNKLYLIVDFHAAVSESITSTKLTGKTITVSSKSDSVTAVDLTAADSEIDLSSSGYGWCKLLIE